MASDQAPAGLALEEQESPRAPVRVTAEPYCVICRGGILQKDTLLCLFKLPSARGPPRVYAHVARAAPSPSSHPTELGGFRAGPHWVEVSSRGPGSSLYHYNRRQPLFFLHPCCWKLFHCKGNLQLSLSRLYQFCELLQPMMDMNYPINDPDEPPPIVPFMDSSFVANRQSSLGSLLNRVARFPIELQTMILELLPSSTLLPFVFGCPQSVILFEHAIRRGCMGRHLVYPFTVPPPGILCVSVTTSSVFGQEYLDRIHVSQPGRRPDGKHEVLVSTVHVAGVKYALGEFGLQAISVLYPNGSASPWIGNLSKDAWYGRAYGSDLRRLQVLQDDLKVNRVRFSREIASPELEMPSFDEVGPLFDTDVDLTAHDKCAIAHPPRFQGQILDHSRQSLCRYLALSQGKHYASGLTVYCDARGTHGITVYGEPCRFIGTTKGRPITFFFGPRETVAAVFLATLGPLKHTDPGAPLPGAGPWLMFKTSTQRVVMFAPMELANGILSWSQLVPDNGNAAVVTGIFAHCGDAPSPLWDIGVMYRDISSPGGGGPGNGALSANIQLRVADLESFWPVSLTLHGWNTFLSVAETPTDAERLQVRRTGPRITGLAIHRSDGDVDVLGRWDPVGPGESVMDIYRKEEGSLGVITFLFEGGPWSSYIADIYTGDDEWGWQSESTTRLTWRQTDDDVFPNGIMWACSGDREEVLPWEGETVDIPINGQFLP